MKIYAANALANRSDRVIRAPMLRSGTTSFPPALLDQLDALSRDGLRRRAPLAPYTTFRIGGPADYFMTVHRLENLKRTLAILHQAQVPYLLLGGGSNILVSDAGVRGLVIINQCRGIHWPEDAHADPVDVRVEAGALLAGFAREAIQRGLAGISWAVSIPGTVGGAIVGNAGAHGGDIASIFLEAEMWHRGRIETWRHEAMAFAYRHSILKQAWPTPPIILSAVFRLPRDESGQAADEAASYIAHRRRTQPTDKSAGSIFRNPPGDYAGRLIEAAGLKGRCIGQACISEKHANFFINRGQATAADIIALMNLARQEVWRQFQVLLEPEIRLIGDWSTGPHLLDPRSNGNEGPSDAPTALLPPSHPHADL